MPLPAPRGCSHDLRGQDWPRSTRALPLPNFAPSTPRVFAQPKGTGLAQVVRRTLANAPMTLVCPQVSTPSQYSDWRTPRATPHNGWRNRLRLLASQQNSYWTANGHRAMHAGRNGGPLHTYVPLRAAAHLRATSRVACAEPALALTSRAPAPTFLAWLNQLTGTSSFRAQTFPGLPRLSLGRPVMPPGQSVTFLLDRQAGLTLTNIPGRALAGGTSALAARGRLTSALRRSRSGRRTQDRAEPVDANRAACDFFWSPCIP